MPAQVTTSQWVAELLNAAVEGSIQLSALGTGTLVALHTASKVEFPDFHCYRKCTGNMSLTFPVHFMHLSYIQYRSYNQEHFLVCRKCHMFCTFSVPIVCSTGHTTRNISWYAGNVTCSVHFLYIFCTNPIQYRSYNQEHFLVCRKCHIFCTFSVPINQMQYRSYNQEHF